MSLELLQLGLRFRRLRLERAAAPFDQVSRAGEVIAHLSKVFIGRSTPWPVSGPHAAADRLSDHPQSLHRVGSGPAALRGRQRRP